MMNLFWRDSYLSIEKSYDDFLLDIQRKGVNNVYIKNKNPYEVFLALLRNILNKKNNILLDADFSEIELNDLGISSEDIEKSGYEQNNIALKYSSFQGIFEFFENSKEELSIDIYTSGTTGRPKKVSQNLNNIMRYVRKGNNHENNIWAFAYNPTHFAGLQVFFQALLNQNTIIYVFGGDFRVNYDDIVKYKVTHISCTPTYMKMLLNYVVNENKIIRSLTFGGERFDDRIEKIIKNKFPNAQLKNVYASSEAGSLLASNGKCFKIPNRYKNLIKISENEELIIHKTLLGDSESFQLNGEWYHTGDLVEFTKNDGGFVFKNRISDFINVGGYKVNPSEIEELLKNIDNVKDALIMGKKNSLIGNVLVAYIILNREEDKKIKKNQIITTLKKTLQDWKVPQIIKFVDTFELTRTGKIKKI
tara:strand:+ start:2571 stop:3827 length:1257 start_codon:yes stop_codon:yes gene_type:complete